MWSHFFRNDPSSICHFYNISSNSFTALNETHHFPSPQAPPDRVLQAYLQIHKRRGKLGYNQDLADLQKNKGPEYQYKSVMERFCCCRKPCWSSSQTLEWKDMQFPVTKQRILSACSSWIVSALATKNTTCITLATIKTFSCSVRSTLIWNKDSTSWVSNCCFTCTLRGLTVNCHSHNSRLPSWKKTVREKKCTREIEPSSWRSSLVWGNEFRDSAN